MDNNIVIFCQAGADVLYTIDLISKSTNRIIHIYVIDIKGIYTFLKKFETSSIIIKFIPNFFLNMYSPFSIQKVKKGINILFEEEFSTFINYNVYFFSTSYDWLTATIVSRLSGTNKIYYCNHYDDLTNFYGHKEFSVKRFIKSRILNYITGVRFSHNITVNFPKFEYKDWQIEELKLKIKPDIPEKYLYKIDIYRFVYLFFLSSEEFAFLTIKSKSKIIDFIINVKNQGKFIALKGHPRMGIPSEIENLFDFIIPGNIPGEFIDYHNVIQVFGLLSTALCYPAQKKLTNVVSLLDLVDFKEKEKKKKFKEYLEAYSERSITFLKA